MSHHGIYKIDIEGVRKCGVILHISAAKLRADKKEGGGGGEGDIQATLR
jgi:hypothetical protein